MQNQDLDIQGVLNIFAGLQTVPHPMESNVILFSVKIPSVKLTPLRGIKETEQCLLKNTHNIQLLL